MPYLKNDRIDITGKVFGRLKATKFSHVTDAYHYIWDCKCECGKTNKVSDKNLINGKIVSCGCIKIIDLSNKRFGRLLVTSKREKNNNGKYYWLCKCDCGNEVYLSGESIRKGNTKSCGCLLYESRFVNPSSERSNVLLKNVYRALSKRHNKRFGNEKIISFELFNSISLSKCFYCNADPSNIMKDVRHEKGERIVVSNNVLQYSGIDRIKNEMGYTTENTIPCCRNCNIAKNTLTQETFSSLIIAIYKNWASTRNTSPRAMSGS